MKHLYFSLFVASLLYGEEMKSFSSFQGFRGVINTPNSEVMNEGEFEYLYTNQVENLSPSTAPDFRDNKEQENFFLNMGILPNLDLNLQYAYAVNNTTHREYLSNRVVSTKYKIPFIPNDLFEMAIGIQDIGGSNPYIANKYAVVSKEFNSFRSSLGYAKGEHKGSIDGVFGSVEFQPLSWLQVAGEYDTKEWNGAIKSEIPITLGEQTINLGLMAKSSLDYNDVYFGIYANAPFNNKNILINKEIGSSINYHKDISSLKLSNTASYITEDKHYFEYENKLYAHSDIDALGMVLGVLATTSKSKNIVISIKKANIVQYTIKVNSEAYKSFLKSGKHQPALLTFTHSEHPNQLKEKHSDTFKPTLTLQPDFVLIDGSEYGRMDYTVAMQAELSMRLAKGTIVSGRYNIPLGMTDNFEVGRVFDYRNRNKTDTELDQLLLTQYLNAGESYPWVGMAQVGRFDKDLEGVSLETGVSDSSGKHHLLLKVAQLKDSLYKEMDRYADEKREERLISYRYYLDDFNSNIKVTAGEFLYGDKGSSISLQRYFSDISLKFDISHTTHSRKGTNNLGKLSLSIPFGTQKYLKTDYLDIKGGAINYSKIKALVGAGSNKNYSLPHHLKEVDNSFTLEKYYLNNNRFHPAYIKNNYNRLRNVFIGN